MIAYDIFLLAPCVSDAYAIDFLCCSRERREERRSLSGPPAFFAPSASGKAYLPDAGSEVYRPGGSLRKGGFECREEKSS